MYEIKKQCLLMAAMDGGHINGDGVLQTGHYQDPQCAGTPAGNGNVVLGGFGANVHGFPGQ